MEREMQEMTQQWNEKRREEWLIDIKYFPKIYLTDKDIRYSMARSGSPKHFEMTTPYCGVYT